MKVLYYKCKEGATHEEIATKLGREVNTVQYHMTNIYEVLEIKKPGKSREEMESELNNEICPIIREMFPTYDDVKIWVPAVRNKLPEEPENPEEEADEILSEDAQPPYTPPPSVRAILGNPENRSTHPEILEPPPPGRHRINWWLILGLPLLGLLIVIVWISFRMISAGIANSTGTPLQPMPTPSVASVNPTETLTDTSGSLPSPALPAREMSSPKDGMVLVYVPEGEFQMGGSKVQDPQALDEELPRHAVYLDHYWIDKTEVSNAQYALCVADGGCARPANNYSETRGNYYDDNQFADYPVIFVSWSQASAYCAWAGRRLPTEAEWEKAARGPNSLIYPWGNTFDGTLANYCDVNCRNDWKDSSFDDGYTDTSRAGEYPDGASFYGVLDMSGNVYEWVADWFGPYNRSDQTNPTGPDAGSEKIIRGGSWGDDPAHIRSSIRSHINGDSWMDFIGFRCAR